MSSQNLNINPVSSGASDDIFHHIFKAIELHLADVTKRLEISKTMLPLGVYTSMTSMIKKTIENPLTQLLTMKADINQTIGSFLTEIVKAYFNDHKDIIAKAGITERGNDNELHFTVALKEDTETNRDILFSLIHDYKTTDLWEYLPIRFQIVPIDAMDRIFMKPLIP